jgi:hypothetical protein
MPVRVTSVTVTVVRAAVTPPPLSSTWKRNTRSPAVNQGLKLVHFFSST